MQVHPYVLPIMQGYYQIAKFTIPPDPLTHDQDAEVDYIVVSRRSRDRAGLRYQRRGIDEDAHVANFVETETIMRVEVCQGHSPLCTKHIDIFQREGRSNVFAYVQLRGSSASYSLLDFSASHHHYFSVPLFWTQTGYGLKPPPLIATDRTHEQHLDALKRHFQRTVPKYGPHVRFVPTFVVYCGAEILQDHRQPSGATWQRGGHHAGISRVYGRVGG